MHLQVHHAKNVAAGALRDAASRSRQTYKIAAVHVQATDALRGSPAVKEDVTGADSKGP